MTHDQLKLRPYFLPRVSKNTVRINDTIIILDKYYYNVAKIEKNVLLKIRL